MRYGFSAGKQHLSAGLFPVPLKPHGRRLERRSDDGQNDLETAVDDTDPGQLGSDVPGTVPQQSVSR
jgi:hypothetical protein